MKKYRVNESEHFNLYSMHDKLKCIEIDMQEAPAHTYTDEQWDDVQERISEVVLRGRIGGLANLKENQGD